MQTVFFYIAAAFFEIAGCFAFWAWIRLDRAAWLGGVGAGSLVLFALALTQVDSAYAGRAYAAYGGVYIIASIIWLLMVEGIPPDRWDLIGGLLCLMGAAIILWGPR
ncbi:MAG: YnfA family protein [Rhodothermales bacterium]